MAGHSQNSKELVEGLADIFVETLKEMAASGKKLAPEAIAKSLSLNPALGSLVSRHSGPATSQSGLRGDLEVLEKRLAKVSGQKEALSTRLKVAETQANRKTDVLTRSLLTVIRQINRDENPAVADALAGFRQALLAGEDPMDMEERLRRLKEIIVGGARPVEAQDGEVISEVAPAERGGGGLFGRFFGKGKKAAEQAARPGEEIYECRTGDPSNDLKEIYLELLAEFQVDLGPDYLGKLHELMRRVNDADDPDYLLTLRGEVTALLRTYVQKVGNERAEAAKFIAELLQRLAYLHEQVLASQTQQEESRAADDKFSDKLSGKIEEMTKQAGGSVDLDELRDIILAKMGEFRTAINEKKLEDKVRHGKIKKIMLAMKDEIVSQRAEVTRVHKENLLLQKKLMTDPLTGVYNRLALRARLDEAFEKARQTGGAMSVIMCDLDNFKGINDSYGHAVGDELLKELAKRLKPALREGDTLARYGGDEFTVVLPGADLSAARAIAEKLRGTIENINFQFRGKDVPTTLSVGVAQLGPEDLEVRVVLQRADKALYQSKHTGRNRVTSV